MRTKILCTLGPASLHSEVIAQLDERDIDLFRINLSHTPLDRLESTIEFLQEQSSTPICLDTEGAQVRCGVMAADTLLHEERTVRLTPTAVIGTADEVTLWPSSIFSELQVGTIVSIDSDGALLRVTQAGSGGADALVLEGGRVGSNRAVTIQPSPRLPPLTEKDVRAIEIGVRHGLQHFALSFASCAADVAQLRALVRRSAYVIAKIESRAGICNMDGIISASDAVLIDRGDLSREIPIEHVPIYQKYIIRRANTWNKSVFVATNLLESMIRNRRPTVAEANDIINTLADGAHGLVLAAETAIGAYPVQSVDMVQRLLLAFEESMARQIFDSVVPVSVAWKAGLEQIEPPNTVEPTRARAVR